MSLIKRGNTWWVDFTAPSGERIRRSCGTSNKGEAQEFHDRLKAESWRVQKLGDKPKYTWDDAGVIELTWDQVDLKRQTAWILGDKAKGKEDIHISLSQMSVELLQRQLGKHQERVFTYAGKPIGQVNTKAWRRALQRAGIENFRWHDLRHTWASWLVQNGTPLYDLQEMAGWKSSEMVRRYAHLAPAHLAKHAAIVENLLCGTNSAQGQK